ncbi:MAG: hypothetical protein ACJ75B_06580 [Flavisolibacter sp.]
MAGYSGTPLAKKLGMKDGSVVSIFHQPEYYFNLFPSLPDNIRFVDDPKIKKDIIHYFTRSAKQYVKDLPLLRKSIVPNGAIWISWPKKSSGVHSDVDEDFIRQMAIKNGLVDIKVCAVDETWSGLKLVIPVKERSFEF